jgi:hypothetical protein
LSFFFSVTYEWSIGVGSKSKTCACMCL